MKSLSLLIIALLVTACGGKPSEPEAAAVMAPEATQEVPSNDYSDTYGQAKTKLHLLLKRQKLAHVHSKHRQLLCEPVPVDRFYATLNVRGEFGELLGEFCLVLRNLRGYQGLLVVGKAGHVG